MRAVFLSLFCLLPATLLGCNSSSPANKPVDATAKSEEEIKQAFVSLQSAIKAKEVDKIWDLLSKDSQLDTEREAKAIKEAFAKFADDAKSGYEKKIGLSAKEITELTGKGYVKSSTFYTGEVQELIDSKFDKAVVAGDSGTVHYTEEPGQKERMSVGREQGQWRFAVPISKAVLK